MAEEKYHLGGRAFLSTVPEITVGQQLFFDAIVARHDLVFQKAAEEAPEAFVQRILQDLVCSEEVLNLLGCLLVPEGQDWSHEVARQTAAFISGLRDEQSKRVVASLVSSLLVGFFVSGLASIEISPSSSSSVGQPEPEPEANAGKAIATGAGPVSSGS